MEPIHECTIKLIRYLMNGDMPDLPENIDYEELYRFSSSHAVENMVYAALDKLGIRIEGQISNDFSEAYDMSIVNEAMQALELETIVEAFEKEGIDNMPLKGSVIKYLYPSPDYRRSGDIDILVRPGSLKKVGHIMAELGYELDKTDEFELHCAYRKLPNILVEIHDRLVEKDNRSYECFSDIWEHVNLKDGFSFQYEMDKEMFYTYMIAHLCKHIKNGGAGIRLVLDIWVMLEKWEADMDKTKLNDLLKTANVEKFNEWAVELSRMWFGGAYTESERVATLEKFVLESGNFGTKEQGKKLKASEATKSREAMLKYKVRRFFFMTFLPYHVMREEYPILLDHKYLLPVMWIRRIVRLLTKERKGLSKQISSSMKVEEGESKRLSELWDAVKSV